MLDIKEITPLLIDFFKSQENILTVYLFGSYIDGTNHEKSDLDIAVLMKEDMGLWREMELAAEISNRLGFEDIDLLNLNKASLRMQFMIVSTGQLIYEINPDLTSDFLERILIHYHDREYRYKAFFTDWDEGLKEDYLDGQSGQSKA